MGRKQGLTQDQVLEINDHALSAAFSPAEKLALELTDQLTAVPANVSNELFERLLAHYSYPQIVELSAAIAFENYRARFNRVFAIESAGFAPGALCPLPEHRPAAAVQH